MRYIVFLLFFGTFFTSLTAQDSSIPWFEDITEARDYASKNESKILMVFAGSDWCKPCIQFKHEILESNDFVDLAKDQLVILYLDFPARKKNQLPADQLAHNESLAERFNKSGAFPSIFLLDSSEEILLRPEYHSQNATEFFGEILPYLTSEG